MNQLLAEITEVNISDDLALITLKCENEIFSSLIISHNESIHIGKKVYIAFKETEVILSEKNNDGISIKNCFSSTIKSIQKGKILAEIILDFKGHSITSIITIESFEKLNLHIGKEIHALIKTNDLLLIQQQ